MKAANGVIVITNKRVGRLNQPPQVSLNINVTYRQPDFSRLRYMSGGDFIDVEQYLFAQGFYDGLENGFNHPPLTPVVELLIQERDGQISKDEADAQVNAMRLHDGKGMISEITCTVPASIFNIRLQPVVEPVLPFIQCRQAGMTTKTTWMLFTGGGPACCSLTCSLAKWLQWQNDIRYTNSLSESGKPSYGEINSGYNNALYPYAWLADNEGNPLSIVKDYWQTFKQQAEAQGLLNWDYYPLEDYRHSHGKTSLQDIVLNEGLLFKNKNHALNAEARFQYENVPWDNYGTG